VRLEELDQLKNPMTSEIKPATFRLVAQRHEVWKRNRKEEKGRKMRKKFIGRPEKKLIKNERRM
jgi:hypothetical protein